MTTPNTSIEDIINAPSPAGASTPAEPTQTPTPPEPAPTPTPSDPTAIPAEHAEALRRAQEILDADEFNQFVESLEGTDELDTGVLRTIAQKLGKETYKTATQASKAAEATAAELATLRAEVAQMRRDAEERRKLDEAKSKTTAEVSQYQKLSDHCSKIEVDLETSLDNPKIKELLQTGSRNEDIPFTYVQEVTAHIARGNFAAAAKVVAEVVKLAATNPADITVTPEAAAAAAPKPVQVPYEQELQTLTRQYAASNKTFADTQAHLDRVAALKAKHGR